MPTVRQQKFGESTNWSSAPLVNHLAGNHKIDKAHQEAFLGSVAVRAPSDQATLTAMMDTEVAASRVLEEAVMDLLCAERLPFRLVESHRFQAVLSAGVRVYDAGLEVDWKTVPKEQLAESANPCTIRANGGASMGSSGSLCWRWWPSGCLASCLAAPRRKGSRPPLATPATPTGAP